MCNICDYETAYKSMLQKHIKSVHEGIKEFKCHKCPYETVQSHHLKKHIETVHEGIKPFNCNICEYKAGQKSDLKKHMSVHKIKPEYKVDILGHILSGSSLKHEQVEIDPSLS